MGVASSRRPAQATAVPLAVLTLVNILNFYDRQALGAITEPLRRDLNLSDTQVGALPTVFTIVYAIAGLPLGRLADTWSRKLLLTLGVVAWSALTALGGLARNYGTLMATRLGVGIGEAACAPAVMSWIGDMVPAHKMARAMAVFMMAVPIGGMLSFAVTGPVAQAYGWRAALAVAASPALVLLPALLWVKEPPRAPRDQLKPASLAALKLPVFWWIVASGALVNFVLYSFSTFTPAFLTRVHGMSVGRAGLFTGIGVGLFGILGGVAAGVAGDRTARHNGRLRLAAVAAAAAAPLAFAAVSMPAGAAFAAAGLLLVAYGLLQTYYALVYATIQDIIPANLKGTAMAVYFMAMYLCGASFGPLITGGLSDYFAREAAHAAGSSVINEAARAIGLNQAMYIIPAVSLALAAVLMAGAHAMAAPARRSA
jgi:MFS family permease